MVNQRQAFPIAIIDEDYEGRSAAGRGMRQLAAEIEKSGFRTVTDLSYEDARRLVNIFNIESCWLVSVDGTESTPTQWQVLEQVLAAKRARNDKLPIFLFGDVHTAETVPTSVLKHANAFMRLFEDSPEFLARAIARSAQLYLDRLPPPMFKALMDYTLHGAATPGTRPVMPAASASARARSANCSTSSFGENTVALRRFGFGRPSRLAARPHRSDRRRRAERGAHLRRGRDTVRRRRNIDRQQDRLARDGVGRGDLVLCDRNCHKSILHSLIMTGATPIYLVPSRNGLGIIGPISRDQFTPGIDAQEDRRQPVCQGDAAARCADGDDELHLRRPVLQHRRHQGVPRRLGRRAAFRRGMVRLREFSRVLRRLPRHFVGAIRRASTNAITFATQSTHKLLCGAVAGLDDPHPEWREEKARHDSLQRRVHDAHVDLAAIRRSSLPATWLPR